MNAAGKVIDAALPKTPKTREHRRVLPYADVPAALEAVEASGAGPVVKAAIRFTALTAVRSGEARGATWGEVDLEARELRVPASRMEHRVPLSDAAVGVIEGMKAHSDGLATKKQAVGHLPRLAGACPRLDGQPDPWRPTAIPPDQRSLSRAGRCGSSQST